MCLIFFRLLSISQLSVSQLYVINNIFSDQLIGHYESFWIILIVQNFISYF